MKRFLTTQIKTKTIVNLLVLCAAAVFALSAYTYADTMPPEVLKAIEANYPDGLPRYLTPEEQQWLAEHPEPAPPEVIKREEAVPLAAPPTGTVHTPAEYEQLDSVLVAWESFTPLLTSFVVEVSQADTNTKVYVVVDTTSERTTVTSTLTTAGANMSNVAFIVATTDTVWIRDYGPRYFLENSAAAIMDHKYNRPRAYDDAFPTACQTSTVPFSQVEPLYHLGGNTDANSLTHGGGNFHCFSTGDAFMSTLILNENTGKTEAQIRDIVESHFNVSLTIYPRLISNVDATGHIDMWFMPLGDNKVLISQFPTSGYPLSRATTEAAAADMASRGYTVYRVPAYNSTGEGSSGGTHFTYTNAAIVNNKVFIPWYNHSADDAAALATFTSAMPGYEIIQIDCVAIIPSAGAIHCVMKHVYAPSGVEPPGQATNPTPSNGATNVSRTQDLSWSAGTGATSRDVYFGTANPPVTKVIADGTVLTYDTGTMATSTTYYWRVDEKNANGTTTGVVWTFTTVPPPPGPATSPSPANGATNVGVTTDLSWTAGTGSPTARDVYFGTASSPPLVSSSQVPTTYDTGTMSNNTTYYWRIDEKNAGGTTTGIVWNFTTVPDTTPPSPSPMTWATVPTATGPTSITMTATTATDNTPPVQYYFECTTDGSKSSSWQTSTTYVASGLTPSTLYSFRVKAHDSAPAQNETGWSSTLSATTLSPAVVYDYTGITNPSSSHKAEDGEIDVADSVIQNGTFGARRDTIAGWASWAEATTAEYAALVSSDNSRYSTADPGSGDNAAMIFELYVDENPADVEQIDISVEINQGAATDASYAYLWNYNTNSYLVLGTQAGTTDQIISASITSNPGNYINPTTGQVTVFAVNMDDSDVIRVDRIRVTVYAQTLAPPGPATFPSPANGAANVGVTTDLNWTAGTGSPTSRDVYFGTASSPPLVSSSQVPTTYDTGTMSNNTTYYWRVDEKNAGGTTTGDVWSFTTKAQVPDVLNMTEAAATTAINNAGLVKGTVTSQCSDTVEAGDVISQDPTGGTQVDVGSSVDLVVSLGLPIIPDVTNTAQAAAEAAITTATFTVGNVTTAYSDTVAAGDVISQLPIGGTAAVSGTAVDLVVSLGLPIIPDVTNTAQAAAEAAITTATFTVGNVTTAYSDTVAAGDVISQLPIGGTAAVSGTAVDLVVSDGPSPRIISGHITEPDANIPVTGVAVDANNGGGSDITDVNGYYELTVVYGWSGSVALSKTGYTFEPNGREYNNVTTDHNDNYIATLKTFIISGYAVDSTLAPLAGVLVTPDNNGGPFTSKYYGGGYDTTDINGYYEVVVDYNWSGKVVPSKYAYAFEPNSITYTNVTEDKAETQNYVGTLLTYTITGYIKNSCEVPIAGVLVNADNGGGSDITDVNGYYEVWVDYNWSGTITPSKAHYTFDPTNKAYTNVLENKTGQDYEATNIYDLDCDGSIDFGDIAVMSENWLSNDVDIHDGDFNDDDIVNFLDFTDFALVW